MLVMPLRNLDKRKKLAQRHAKEQQDAGVLSSVRLFENGEARNGGQQFQHSLLRPMV